MVPAAKLRVCLCALQRDLLAVGLTCSTSVSCGKQLVASGGGSSNPLRFLRWGGSWLVAIVLQRRHRIFVDRIILLLGADRLAPTSSTGSNESFEKALSRVLVLANDEMLMAARFFPKQRLAVAFQWLGVARSGFLWL